MLKIPCDPNCSKRAAGCHGKCGRYRRFRKALDEENEQKRKIGVVYAYRKMKRERVEKVAREIRARRVRES